MRRAAFERWSAIIGGCALAGAFYYYTLFAVTARAASGELDTVIRSVVDGRADAPYQYRFLVPRVLVWSADHLDVSLAQATIVLDGVAIAVGAALGVALLRRAGLGTFSFPALVYCAFTTIGLFLFPSPETTTGFVCVTATLLAIERRPVDAGWWSPTLVWGATAIAAAVLIGCRADLLAALAAGFGARWWKGRAPSDAVTGVVLAVAAGGSLVALSRIYPDAHYRSGFAPPQLTENVRALPVVVLASFLAPALGPLLLLIRRSDLSTAVANVASRHLPLLAVVATEVLLSFVFGRIDEVRLLFPVSFVLAWVGIDLWRAVVASLGDDLRV